MRAIESHLEGFPHAGARRTLIGGVGYRWQGDLSFGLAVTDELARRDLPPHLLVADLGYGAIYAAQDVADMEPRIERLVLVTSTVRDRPPGRLYEFMFDGMRSDDLEIQARVREAGAGVIHVDHLLVVGTYLKALPDEVLVVEAEPSDHLQGEHLSPALAGLVPGATDMLVAALSEGREPVRVNGTTGSHSV